MMLRRESTSTLLSVFINYTVSLNYFSFFYIVFFS